MAEEKMTYYEVEGAVFRHAKGGKMEVFSGKTGQFKPYTGDVHRVVSNSHPMTLDEVEPYMEKRAA